MHKKCLSVTHKHTHAPAVSGRERERAQLPPVHVIAVCACVGELEWEAEDIGKIPPLFGLFMFKSCLLIFNRRPKF